MAEIIDSLSFVPGVNLDDQRFTDEEILQAETLIAASISGRQPTLDMSPASSLYDIHVRPAAINYLLNRRQNEALLATRSLKGVIENPELASDAVVDAILSNDGIKRRSGSIASGIVRISVSRDIVYTISSGQVFQTSTGLKFVSLQSWLVMSDPTATNHLRLYPADSLEDQFFFLLPVAAISAGLESQIAADIELISTVTIPNFISSYSFGAFTGAVDEETNEQLIDRIPEAKSAKNRVSRVAISAELKENFPTIVDVSVQGCGDAALRRGVGGILPVKGGGFADIWVRTSLAAEATSITAVATLDSKEADGRGICSAIITTAEAPAHYFVGSVRPGNDQDYYGSYPIISQTKSIGASGNKISSVAEGAYTKFQSTEFVFAVDPVEGQPIFELGDEFTVQVELIGLPLIDKIQDFISDHDSRAAGTDYLVRACVPCFVWCAPITVHIDSTVNPADIQTKIFRYINSIPMGDNLFVDGVVLAIRSVPGVVRVTLPIRLHGRIFAPDGTEISLSSENSLAIPDRPDLQVVPGTVAFFVGIDDISLNTVVVP